jgi:hypothetical protein
VDGTSVVDLTKSEKFSFDHCFGPNTGDWFCKHAPRLRVYTATGLHGTLVRQSCVAASPRSGVNQDIFDGMGCNIPEAVFSGKNGTLFAYGQTSAGRLPHLHRDLAHICTGTQPHLHLDLARICTGT